MWPERGIPALIVVLWTASFLGAGCASPLANANSLGSSSNSVGGSNSLGPSDLPASAAVAPKREPGSNGDGRIVLAADTSTSATTPSAYRIGPADILDISVFNVPELSKTVQVAETGTVNFPLVGEVPAAGKTAQQLERELTAKLGAKYLQNPQVTVLVKENNSQRVTVEGAVKTPGVYPMKGGTTLLQSMAMAGGLDPSSDSTVLVLRTSGGKRSAAKFDVAAIQKGKAEDPALQAGDVLVVGTSAIRAGFNNILKFLPVASLFAFL
jgi:polysaccharide export outer membrane protein